MSFYKKDDKKYTANHSRQLSITSAIVSDLIVGCSMPLSLVENPNFRHFMEVVDSKYTVNSRSTVTSTITKLASKQEEDLRSLLSNVPNVSVTIDIWSDRKMRGFLGVTAHMLELKPNGLSLRSVLLCCQRFKGSHTGEKIGEAFETLCTTYGLKNKIDYITCDNAANMKKAFTVSFANEVNNVQDGPTPTDNDMEIENDGVDGVPLDDDDIWEVLGDNDQAEVNAVLMRNCRRKQLSCFAHTLQLVVSDGLKESKMLRAGLSKASKLCSLLHTSCLFKQAFESKFGVNKSIPAVVCTRWHSTYKQVKSITALDNQVLADLVKTEGHKDLVFTTREWNLLLELVQVMCPFYDATVIAQGETTATIGIVVPSILSISRHLRHCAEKPNCQLTTLIRGLEDSLVKRFKGIFLNMKLLTTTNNNENDGPFGDIIYTIAAVLDPTFCFMWLDNDVPVDENVKDGLRKKIKGS